MAFHRLPWTEGQKQRANSRVPGTRLDENGCLVHHRTGKKYFGGKQPKPKRESLAEYKTRMKGLCLDV